MPEDRHNEKFGERLVREKLCTEPEIREALLRQAKLQRQGRYQPLGAVLVDQGRLEHRALVRCLRARHLESLLSSRLFQEVSPELVEQFLDLTANQVQPENTVIARKGDSSDCVYFVVSGRVQAYAESQSGAENVLGIYGPGDTFGEIGFLSAAHRQSSYKTLEPTSLLILPRGSFTQVFGKRPEILQGFIRVLAERVHKDVEVLIQRAENDKAFQEMVSARAEIPFHPLAGESVGFKKVLKQIQKAAGNNDPVLFVSPPGTMKTALAKAVHDLSDAASGPFLEMNAPPAAGEGESEPMALADREILQYSILFGHEGGGFSPGGSRQPGLLEICRNGAVVVKNVETLAPSIQERLFEYLESGLFRPIGGGVDAISNARVMATTAADLGGLVQEGRFSPRLFGRLEGQIISAPPLQKRKKDLEQTVFGLIAHANAETGKNIQGIDPEAYQRIMAYDWPGDMEELHVVVRRAVSLAEHDLLMPEDLFMGMVPPEGKYVLNLLKFDAVKNFFTHRFFPVGFQAVTGIVFLGIILAGFLGSQDPESNISLIIAWALWWPMVVVSWFLGARAWCSVCPMGGAGDLAGKLGCLKLKIPKFIKDYGAHLSALGLCVIVWSEASADMPNAPRATAVLLTVILLLAFLSGLLFERRVWCRYLCPLGMLCAAFSGCSVVELRSNRSICNTTCKTPVCYKGTEDQPGCPLFQGPFSLKSNQNCILCGNCVKLCENSAPAFNFRVPGHELWAIPKPEKATSIFIPAIIGIELFMAVEDGYLLERFLGAHPGWFALGVLMAVFVLAAFGFVRVSGRLFVEDLKDPSIKKGDLYNYALIPLALGFMLAHHSGALLEKTGKIFPVLGRQLGADMDFLDFSSALGAAIQWQVLFIGLGTVGSLVVLAKLLKNHRAGTEAGFRWKSAVPVFALAFIYLFFYISAQF